MRFVGEQVGVESGPEAWLRYDWSGRSVKYHRAQIRNLFGFREATVRDGEKVASWLLEEELPREQDTEKLRAAFHERCRALKIEPPTPDRVDRLVASASHRFEGSFCASVLDKLSKGTSRRIDALLDTYAYPAERKRGGPPDPRRSALAWVKADPGRPSLDAVLDEVAKLARVREVGLPRVLFSGDPPALVKEYRRRAQNARGEHGEGLPGRGNGARRGRRPGRLEIPGGARGRPRARAGGPGGLRGVRPD